MLGHLSAAYSARTSRDVSLSSRFDFNVYSYESELTMGAEWWLRRRLGEPEDDLDAKIIPPNYPERNTVELGPVQGVVKARASTNNVSFSTLIWPNWDLL